MSGHLRDTEAMSEVTLHELLGVRGLNERLELLHKIIEAITLEPQLTWFLQHESRPQLLAMEAMERLF